MCFNESAARVFCISVLLSRLGYLDIAAQTTAEGRGMARIEPKGHHGSKYIWFQTRETAYEPAC